MPKKRLIAVLIVRDGKVVQSIRFKHTNVIHSNPVHAIEAFNKWAVDEIVVLNVSRQPDASGHFAEVVSRVSRHCFVPLSVGGWIIDSSIAARLLRSGADKLVLNTAFQDDHDLVHVLSRRYGRQCIVCSMDVKRNAEGETEVMVDRGRRATGKSPLEWLRHTEELGAGEILFNSIDNDGARKGYDLDTLELLCAKSNVPVIAFGGVQTWHHLMQGINAGADAVAAANIFHYTEQATRKAKSYLADHGVDVRVEGRSLV